LRKDSFLKAGTITAVGALLGAIAAVTTGLIAEDSVWLPAAALDILETHEAFGFIVLGLIAAMATTRLVFRNNLEGMIIWLMVFMGAITAAAVIYGSYLGGEMVYTHGAGVKAAKDCLKQQAHYEDESKALKQLQ